MGMVSKNRVCLSTAEKKLSTIPRQNQAKWAKFSVLSRISLFHRQENLRKGLTTDWKSVKIHIDHIRVIWRIRIILSAGAGRVRREERRPRLLSSKQQCKKGSRRPCTVAFCLAFASGFVPCGGRGRAAVRACAGSQERSGRFPDRPPAGKLWGSSGTVLRFSRNPVTFYGETLDNPDLA